MSSSLSLRVKLALELEAQQILDKVAFLAIRESRVDMGQIRKAVRGRNWELRRVVQARIEEPAFPMHFEIGYESVPVWYGTPADPGVEVHSSKTKGWRN